MRIKTLPRLRVAAAVAGSLVLFAGACGSSSKTGSSATSATTVASGGGSSVSSSSTAAAANKAPIVLGMVVGATGSEASNAAGVIPITQAWEKWVNNDLGGIDGHPVRVVTIDDQSSGPLASTTAEQLVQQDHVIASVGSFDGGDEAIFTKVFTDAHIPVIGGSWVDPVNGTSSPYVFDIDANADNGTSINVQQAKTLGATKYGAVICSEYAVCLTAVGAQKAYAGKIGVNWAGDVPVAAADPNYNAACLTLQNKNVNFTYLGLTEAVWLRVIQNCTQEGFTPSYYGVYASVDGHILPLTKGTKVRVAVTLTGFPWWTATPAIVQYRNVVAKYAPKGLAGTVYDSSNTTGSWAALELFRQAMLASPGIENAAAPTSADVLAAMDNVKNDDLGGLLPQPLTFTAGQPSKEPTCTWTAVFANGEPGPAATTCLGATS